MEKLPLPLVRIDDFYDDMISGMTRKKEVDGEKILYKDIYKGIKPILLEGEKLYSDSGERMSFHELDEEALLRNIDTSDMEYLYSEKFLKKAKVRYDQIKSLPKNGKCPYCGERLVEELDHFLPKSKYPIFSVTPYNLVPSCHKCNHNKRESAVKFASKVIINPYFDDLNKEQWLFCDIYKDKDDNIYPDYFVSPDKSLSEVQKERIRYHFELLNLKEYYEISANEVIYLYSDGWKEIFRLSGKEGLITELKKSEAVYTAKKEYINSFQRALYQGLATYIENER
ncbi:hypothetical protein HCJ70_05080 [Listeria booriae]|uniref:hypothetical protein n=1 Tax=Listeria booriae TaxID=1552123 RepID=UPI001628E534|nr:hypothetical protein [Listeria booriae]MBC2098412.1 hypothetical protein [Listeria booriae]